MKTSNQISETLMSNIESDMEAISKAIWKVLLQKSLSLSFKENIDPRKVFERCYMFCDELFLELNMS